MNVVVCWSHFAGYTAACWRALAATPGVRLRVLAFEADAATPFDPGLLAGVPHRLLNGVERTHSRFVRKIVLDALPDVLIVGAWNHAAYRAVVADPANARVKKVLCIDTPLRNDWRQWIGRRLLRSHLQRFDRIAVPGERAAAYARFLGFEESQIRHGLYAMDAAAFNAADDARRAQPAWPEAFLYVGRYASEKGIDVLAQAYRQYRAAASAVGDRPWALICCGRGPEGAKLIDAGATDLGFIAPSDQPAVFARAGAFVIASRYEPWGVAIAEAAASGLPLVCSDACGAGPELLRDGFNGYRFTTDDAAMLAARMAQIACQNLPEWGRRSREIAAPFDAQHWPARILDGYLPGSVTT